MNTNTLPTDDLKKYGIIDEKNSFSQKLSVSDIQNFLQGHIIIVENADKKATFQLSKNNSKLDVNFYHLNKKIDDILNQAKETPIQYVIEHAINHDNTADENIKFKAFVYDQTKNEVKEMDMVSNNIELTQWILNTDKIEEKNRYKTELLKLKSYLQDKIDKFPEIAKEITEDLNIVSKTINILDDATPNESQAQKQGKSDIQLNVNDPDIYQDANEAREEEWKQEQERKRGFRR